MWNASHFVHRSAHLPQPLLIYRHWSYGIPSHFNSSNHIHCNVTKTSNFSFSFLRYTRFHNAYIISRWFVMISSLPPTVVCWVVGESGAKTRTSQHCNLRAWFYIRWSEPCEEDSKNRTQNKRINLGHRGHPETITVCSSSCRSQLRSTQISSDRCMQYCRLPWKSSEVSFAGWKLIIGYLKTSGFQSLSIKFLVG